MGVFSEPLNENLPVKIAVNQLFTTGEQVFLTGIIGRKVARFQLLIFPFSIPIEERFTNFVLTSERILKIIRSISYVNYHNWSDKWFLNKCYT